MVYANWDYEVGICVLDSVGNVISNEVVLKNEALSIDPTIMKYGEEYYITITSIQGNVNNGDDTQQNGVYTVQMYKSKDLKTWDYVSDIVKYQNNIEDIDLIHDGEILSCIFEKEVIDKGMSTINVVQSKDMGKSWSTPKELLSLVADQEPARLCFKDDKWYLYYSSDKDNIGKSYSGAKAYYAIFDKEFNKCSQDHMIKIEDDKGVLLYDVEFYDDKVEFLYAQDYLNENSLVLESIAIE